MHYSDARQLIRKCQLLHGMLASVDVFLFPPHIVAHEAGTKTVAVSHLDSSYVLTGGYDQILRIWYVMRKEHSELVVCFCGRNSSAVPRLCRDTESSKCLAQFVGHESVITWCQFNAVDSWIASGSFFFVFAIHSCWVLL